MNIRDLLDPSRYVHYQKTLAAAYDALVKVEDALEGIAMRLENEHWCISSAFAELEPLLIQPHTRADAALELFEQSMERIAAIAAALTPCGVHFLFCRSI